MRVTYGLQHSTIDSMTGVTYRYSVGVGRHHNAWNTGTKVAKLASFMQASHLMPQSRSGTLIQLWKYSMLHWTNCHGNYGEVPGPIILVHWYRHMYIREIIVIQVLY